MNRMWKMMIVFAVLISLRGPAYATDQIDENDPLAGCDTCFDDLKSKEKKKQIKPKNKKKSSKEEPKKN